MMMMMLAPRGGVQKRRDNVSSQRSSYFSSGSYPTDNGIYYNKTHSVTNTRGLRDFHNLSVARTFRRLIGYYRMSTHLLMYQALIHHLFHPVPVVQIVIIREIPNKKETIEYVMLNVFM
jgi:hypothetical protein